MPIKPYVFVGGTALFLGIIMEALGAWQLIDWLAPPEWRVVISSILFIIAILCLGKAAWSAWELERNATAALRIANESNAALERRVQQAESKLARAIDQQILDWSPALDKLLQESEKRVGQMRFGHEDEMRTTANAFLREMRTDAEKFRMEMMTFKEEARDAIVAAMNAAAELQARSEGGDPI